MEEHGQFRWIFSCLNLKSSEVIYEQNTRFYIVPHLVRRCISLSRQNEAATTIENPRSSFQKPMHRSISINLVTKIEYAEFQTEADMNLYEIYFINLWKPPLNIDDKCKDELTVHLPDVEWKIFTTHLWDKWKNEITIMDNEYQMKKQEKMAKFEMDRIMRDKWRTGEITEGEYYKYLNSSDSQ